MGFSIVNICALAADANGDGFVDFDEFECLMNSPVVQKPNMLNRVSMLPRAIPATIDEASEEAPVEAPAVASPVNSLMSAMENK